MEVYFTTKPLVEFLYQQ